MKQFLLTALAIAIFTTSFAQTTVVQKESTGTTKEIYNYVTKGLRTTIDQGLDIKKGYNIIKNKSLVFSLNGYTAQVALMIKESDSTVVADPIFIYKGKNLYTILCLPAHGSAAGAWENYWSDYNGLNAEAKNIVDLATTKALSYFSKLPKE